MSADPNKLSQPAITSANLPKEPVAQPRVPASELDDSIVARSLVNEDWVEIPFANPNLQGRWINWKAGEGMRFAQAEAQGYRVVKKEDLRPGGLAGCMKDGGTKYLSGDLIAMCMPKTQYFGALKKNFQTAQYLSQRGGQTAVAANQVNGALNNAGANRPSVVGKIGTFVPDSSDLGRLGVKDE